MSAPARSLRRERAVARRARPEAEHAAVRAPAVPRPRERSVLTGVTGRRSRVLQ
jgi:hypothetical protein